MDTSISARRTFGEERNPWRSAVLGGVVALHVGAVYAMTHWIMRPAPPQKPQVLEVALIAEQAVPEARITPPPVNLFTPPVTVDVPLVELPSLPEPTRAITVAARLTP